MKYHYLILVGALALAACGDTKQDRIASGAAVGAVAGGVVGAASGSTSTGILVGGALGGAAGGLTDKADIDLGKPIWK
jgi:osmotically inducible lipoprotein OsmB